MTGRFVSRLRVIVILGGLFGIGTASASAQCLANELQKLTASDGTLGDHFGTSVHIHGDLGLIGTVLDDENGLNTGAVYSFTLIGDEWVEQQKLVAADPGPQDEFGISVAINPVDPDLVIVGAWLDDPDDCDGAFCQVGSAYIFRFDPSANQWVQEQKLTAADGDSQDHFGIGVSIWGDTAMVGAYLDEDPNIDTGSVYVFRYDEITETWVEQQKLIPSDWQFFPRFGWSVSLEGDVAVIGAPTHSEQAFAAGAAYVYRFDPDTSGWIEEQKLQGSDPAEFNLFGVSVSLSGDAVLIGATFGDAPPLFNSGAAYIFQFNGKQWIEQQKLTASDGGFSDQFGRSVSLSGQTAIIGALLDDDVANASGSAYVFTYERGAWIERAKLHSSDIEAGDLFGASVAVDQDRAFVGATYDDDDGIESGSAYVFGGLGDCNENGELDLCDIAEGFSTDDNNNGIPDECEPPPCPWDLDNNGTVGASDLLSLLASWGPCKGCPADFDDNGNVGASDLLALLVSWGPCP